MAADITLVNVNLMYAVVGGHVDFQVYNPLGLLYLAAVLEREGFDVDLRDYQLLVKQNHVCPFDLEGFCDFLDGAADVIGFSCMSNLLPFTLLAARRIRERCPQKTIILGGVGPSGVAREILERFDWIDYVCYGEGEDSLTDLLARLKRTASSKAGPAEPVPGVYSRWRGNAYYRPRRRITDLDSLPLPAYHLVDLGQYDAALSVITSRGCPYKCTFCTETNQWNNQVALRSVEAVIEEIRLIASHSRKRVFLFQDDQITLDRARAIELCRRLADEKPRMLWKCFARIDQVDEELLEYMATAGCIQIRFGVESGSNRILRLIRKGFTIEQAYEVVRLAVRHLPSVHASFIWGYPDESLAECEETVRWISAFQDAGCTVLNFLLSPLANCEIYRNYTGPLDFNPNLMANFNVSGGEDVLQSGMQVLENAEYVFDFIRRHPRVFPGFFLYDYQNNVKPKQRIVHRQRRMVFRDLKKVRIGDYEEVDL